MLSSSEMKAKVQAKSFERKIAPPQARNFQIAYAQFPDCSNNSICLRDAKKQMFKNVECLRDANLTPTKHSNHFSSCTQWQQIDSSNKLEWMPISPNGNSETILKKHHSELK